MNLFLGIIAFFLTLFSGSVYLRHTREKQTKQTKGNKMKIKVNHIESGHITVKIEEIGLEATFHNYDEATKFIQSVIKNIKSF